MNTPHDFAPFLAAFFRGVLQASWQGSLAVGLVLLLRRVLGARVPARWHYLLWFLVLARLLVPAFVLPRSPASLENIRAVAHPFERVGSAASPQAIVPPTGSLPATLPVLGPGTSSRVPAPAAGARPGVRAPWSPWLLAAGVWLGGVVGISGWLAAGVFHLHRRLRRATVPVDGSVHAVWNRCCARWLGGMRPPRVLAAAWVDSPALVGWWRPTLLLPERSLAAYSEQDLEHVFAHEIAHLRSHDHRTQILVLAAWCVHWFNPVVSVGFRRLRADRELAADEWVLSHLEDHRALAYGETLFKTLAGRPARLAFQPGVVGISEDGAQMKQRLRRIAAFLPGRRVRGSLAGLGVALALGAVVLGQGSPSPAVTAKPSPPPKIRLSAGFQPGGRISLADGSPPGDRPVTLTFYSSDGHGHTETSRQPAERDGTYDFPWISDDITTVTAAVQQEGSAVVFAGPFERKDLDQLKAFHFILERGADGPVQVVDEAGEPIGGARLFPYYPGPPPVDLAEVKTEDDGRAVVGHIDARPVNIRVLADGFRRDEVTGIVLAPGWPYRWTLKKTTPLLGIVTDAAGQPIAGATIKLAGVRGVHDETHYDPCSALPLTVSGPGGRFILGSLEPDDRYYLFIEAPGHGGVYLRGVMLAQGELKVVLGPELSIRGKIVHAPPSRNPGGVVYLHHKQVIDVGDNTAGGTGSTIHLHPVNGEAEFTAGPFYQVYDASFTGPPVKQACSRKPVSLYTGDEVSVEFNIDDLPLSGYVLDLAGKPAATPSPSPAPVPATEAIPSTF